MKELILAVFAMMLAFGANMSLSAVYPPPTGAYQPTQHLDHPAQLLRDKLNSIRGFMQQGTERDPASVMRFLQKEVAPHFELDMMARWIAGPYYQEMSDREQNRFQDQLKENIFMAVSRQIGIFSNQQLKMNFYPPRRIGNLEVAIAMRILQPKQSPIRLTFNFHYENQQGWKVYDVSMNGLSAIAHYRNYYRAEVGRYGPQAFFR